MHRLHILLTLILLLTTAARAEDRLSMRIPAAAGADPRSYFRYELAPGAQVEDVVELRNESESPLTVRTYAGDAFNTPDGSLNGGMAGDVPAAAGAWIQLEAPAVELPPKTARRVRFRLRVPEGVATGDHFALIFLQPLVADAPTVEATGRNGAVFNVRIAQRLAVTVWTRVPGDVRRQACIDAPRKNVFDGALSIRTDVRNTGNTFLKPRAAWSLTTAAGERVAGRDAFPCGYLLPGGRLELNALIDTRRPLPRGEYTFEVTVEYEDARITERRAIQLP